MSNKIKKIIIFCIVVMGIMIIISPAVSRDFSGFSLNEMIRTTNFENNLTITSNSLIHTIFKNLSNISNIPNIFEKVRMELVFQLEDSVQNSNPNDVIIVPVANGNINNVIEINHNLTICGENDKLIKLNTGTSGAIFKISPNATLKLENIEISDLNIDHDNKIIENEGNLILNKCTFNNNKVANPDVPDANKGYVIYNSKMSNSTIINSNFINNSMFLGNVIYNDLSENIIISKSIFRNNVANGFGSAINNKQSDNITINESVFDSNRANFGGAVYNVLFSNKRFISEKNNFTNNYADFKGGAIYNSDGAGTEISSNNFKNNTAEEEGGAIYNNNCDDFRIKTTVFDNNEANRGGGVYTTSAVANMDHSIFRYNHAGTGGAVYNSDGKKYSYVYNNCTFGGNGAKVNEDNTYGGAITLNNANFQFTESQFLDNSASKGSAIFVGKNCELSLKDDSFKRNKLNSSSQSYGGAIYNDEEGIITIIRSNFAENSAQYGGSIFSLANLNINSSSFTNNTALWGGAIYNINGISSNSLNINNSIFNDNNADDGGAIYNNLAEYTTISNSNFNNNTAKNSGGALYNTGNHFSIINSNIDDNSAKSGGALYTKGSYFSSIDSHFNNNTANEGSALWIWATNVYLTNSYINNQKTKLGTSDIFVPDISYYGKYIYIT
ncbi:MAG: hypothetical protein LBT10_03405 [Methanobrevibacter sp.]|jgi:predicted outer membrane repeat protein|nr:hypothetical protein [Methanobrevibacter sp.]